MGRSKNKKRAAIKQPSRETIRNSHGRTARSMALPPPSNLLAQPERPTHDIPKYSETPVRPRQSGSGLGPRARIRQKRRTKAQLDKLNPTDDRYVNLRCNVCQSGDEHETIAHKTECAASQLASNFGPRSCNDGRQRGMVETYKNAFGGGREKQIEETLSFERELAAAEKNIVAATMSQREQRVQGEQRRAWENRRMEELRENAGLRLGLNDQEVSLDGDMSTDDNEDNIGTNIEIEKSPLTRGTTLSRDTEN